MTEKMAEFLETAENDAALAEKINSADSADAFIAIAKEAGFDLAEEDLALELPEGELSDDDIDSVTGGTMESQSMASQSMFSKSMASQSMASQSMFSKSMFGKSMASKSMFGKSMASQSMFSKSMTSKSQINLKNLTNMLASYNTKTND